MYIWKEGVNSHGSEGLEEPTPWILLVAESVRARSSTPCPAGMVLPRLGRAERIGKPQWLWLFYPCTVHTDSAPSLFLITLPKHSCSELGVQAKGALSSVGEVVRWHRGHWESVEMRAGWNGVFPSLGLQT